MVQEIGLETPGEQAALYSAPPSREDLGLAAALVADAEQNAADGREQERLAVMARNLVVGVDNEQSRDELNQIAVWHYEQSAACFRRAVVGYESAAKIRRDENKGRQCLEKAARAEKAAVLAELAAIELKGAAERAERRRE
ncbi:MAG: hypothetical protein JSS81_14925 [Acidobacteria bacterium]|nr:hypothetical protein [Acidobacteriota bacterium]